MLNCFTEYSPPKRTLSLTKFHTFLHGFEEFEIKSNLQCSRNFVFTFTVYFIRSFIPSCYQRFHRNPGSMQMLEDQKDTHIFLPSTPNTLSFPCPTPAIHPSNQITYSTILHYLLSPTTSLTNITRSNVHNCLNFCHSSHPAPPLRKTL